MGAGCSKGAAEVVTADATTFNSVENHNSVIKDTNVEHREETSQPAESHNEQMEQKPSKETSDMLNVEAPASSHEEDTANATEDQNPQAQDVGDQSTVLLTSFCEKNPKLESDFKAIRDHYQALKEAMESGNLMSKAAYEHVDGLLNLYFKNGKSATIVLTDYAVALGIPKLFYDIVVDCRTNCKELTTWDRELEEEKAETKNDANDTSASPENKESKDDEGVISTLKMLQDVICLLIETLWNYSDTHDQFCLTCNELGMVQLFVDIVKELQDSIPHNVKYVDPQKQKLTKFTVRGLMLSRSLAILHDMSKREETRESFAACQAVNTILIPIFKVSEITFYSAKSLLVLANLIDEENNHLIMADEGPIKFLTRLLRKAVDATSHRYLNFAARELAHGLAKIAVNDNNKKTIVKCGAIPVLVKLLQNAKYDVEKINACNLLWTLAFDEENRKQIKNDESAIPELKKLATSENSEIKRAAAGALWECEGKEKHAQEKQQSVKQEATDTKHVMISYQWDVQKLVIQLKNKLQADGYKVWMDIDEMGGSTLESMARAVENASVVLVCVSQKYKESPNCRSEAEYTYQLHKDVIPLMMDSKYRPDGWLGFIVGSKFWIDFSEKHKLDSNADKLVRELGNRGKITAQGNTVQAKPVNAIDASRQSSISSWTLNDVKKWLKETRLRDRLDPNGVQRLDGPMLIRLQELRRESPEFFYSSVRTDFKLNNVFDVLEFTDALEKLAG
ncbi:uncharacterized protein LOC144650989 isoform X1 [Oculina patagonica]